MLTHETSGQYSQQSLLAIKVREISYAYSTNFSFCSSKATPILEDCSINVPKGKIYALLGSNGCGKTTLIRCIIGRLRPQSGNITAFGVRASLLSKNRIGYMPQQISLCYDLTVEENLRYFARLYGMNNNSIEEKSNALLKLLSLPNKTRLVSSLSDGQKRRVSLSTVLMHSPQLLILDEPTVGVDPILRNVIWNYIETICKTDSVTVIITTHYIEEARNASTVGFLRDGKLLVEHNPEVLLNNYKCKSLEDVFLRLCVEKDSNNISHKSDHSLQTDNKSIECENEKFFTNDSDFPKSYCKHTFRYILPMIEKNSLQLIRNKPHITLAFILMPSAFILIFWYSLLNDIKFNISVHNEENPAQYSQLFLDSLDSKKFNQRFYDNKVSAIESINSGESRVAISISKNFSQSIRARYETVEHQSAIYDRSVHDEHSDNVYSDIQVFIDLSEPSAQEIMPELNKAYVKVIRSYISSIGDNEEVASLPIQQNLIYGTSDASLWEFTIPGHISSLFFVIPLFMISNTIIAEKREGILERSLVAGVNSFHYFVTHFTLRFGLLITQSIITIVILYPIIGDSGKQHIMLLMATLVSQGITGIAFGLIIAVVCTQDVYSIALQIMILIPTFLLSGAIWPIEAMPDWARAMSVLFPITHTTHSLQCILNRGWNIVYFEVWIAFVSNFCYTFLYIMFACLYSQFVIFSK